MAKYRKTEKNMTDTHPQSKKRCIAPLYEGANTCLSIVSIGWCKTAEVVEKGLTLKEAQKKVNAHNAEAKQKAYDDFLEAYGTEEEQRREILGGG